MRANLIKRKLLRPQKLRANDTAVLVLDGTHHHNKNYSLVIFDIYQHPSKYLIVHKDSDFAQYCSIEDSFKTLHLEGYSTVAKLPASIKTFLLRLYKRHSCLNVSRYRKVSEIELSFSDRHGKLTYTIFS